MTIRESFTEGQGDEGGSGRSRRSWVNRFDKKKSELSDIEDHVLVAMAQQGAEDAVEVLLLRYRGLVKSITARICRKSPALYSSYEDLTQEGMIGLWDAVMRYKPFYGAMFRTYAVRRVYGATYDAMRANSDASRKDVRNMTRVELARDKLSRELLREPTTKEWRDALPEELQCDLDRIREQKEQFSHAFRESDAASFDFEHVPCEEEWSPEYRVLAKEEERTRNKFMKLLLCGVPKALSPPPRVCCIHSSYLWKG